MATFTPEMQEVAARIRDTTDRDERGELLIQLAQMYEPLYDPSDASFTEPFHRVMEDYHNTYLAMTQAGLRLGRALLSIYDDHAEDEAPMNLARTLPTQTN